MLDYQSLEIKDFSGGLTDNTVGTDPKRLARARNIFLTTDNRARVRDGSEVDVTAFDTRSYIPGHTRVDNILPPLDASTHSYLLKISQGKFYYDNTTTTLTELQGPTSNSMFPSTSTICSYAIWNSHALISGYNGTTYYRPVKVYPKGSLESSPPFRLRSAGLPKPTFTPSIASGTKSVYYGFCYKYTYYVNGRTFIDRSAIKRVSTTLGGNGASLSGILALSNGSGENYDVTNVEVEVYRTVENGTQLFYLATLSYGTTTYSDTVSDAILITSTQAYTNGGIVDNDPPPKCKYVHVSELNLAYYINCVEIRNDGGTAEVYENRVYQSKPNDIDSCNETLYADFDDKLVGGSSYKGVPIIGGKNNIYRIDGKFDSQGAGGMVPKKIANFVGLISHKSMVQTPDGVFFAGTDGFYWTDGYKVLKISQELNETYRDKITTASATDQERIEGAYDAINRRVWWTYKQDSDSTDQDSCFVFDLAKGIKPDACFTIMGGEGDEATDFATEGFEATALCYYQGYMYRGHTQGYCFRHKASLKTDPYVDTNVASLYWGTKAIIYDLATVYLNLGQDSVRKWTPQFVTNMKISSDISVQPLTDRDLEQTYREGKEIKEDFGASWMDPGLLWGDPALWSLDRQVIERKRHVATPGLRCSHRQYRFTNAYTVIAKSDTLGLATVNNTANTATLVNTDNDWPEDCIDYYISFEHDDYTEQYPISARTSDTVLTITDSGNTLPTGNKKWMIKGYAKGQILHLLSLVAFFAPITDSQKPYQAGEESTNA